MLPTRPLGGEGFVQVLKSGERARLDRAERGLEVLGDLRLSQSGEVGEFEHLSIRCRETVEARADPRPGRQAGDCFVLGHWPAERLELELPVGASLLVSDVIDRAPVNEGEQPGGRLGALRAVAASLPPRGQKRLLDSILGEGLVAEYSDREPESRPGVTLIELPEGALVPTRHEREQVLVASDGRRDDGVSHT